MKILKAILGLILIILGISLLVVAYYLIADIETKVPEGIEETCNLEVETFIGRHLFILTPKEEKSDKVILYFHGGAYVAEATDDHWEFLEKIVNDTGATVIMPDYPLTPKYTYKDVFTMVTPLYKEIIDKVEKENLIVMGDSAGGGIATALMERISDDTVDMPSKVILISPWLDVRLENPKIEEIQKIDNELNKDTLRIAGITYAGQDGMDNYLVNPIDGDLSKLENVTILTGTRDILNPDAHLFVEKAKEQGTEIELKEYNDAGHIWMIEKNSSSELIQKGYDDIIALINS